MEAAAVAIFKQVVTMDAMTPVDPQVRTSRSGWKQLCNSCRFQKID